jgi:hypothetical protein
MPPHRVAPAPLREMLAMAHELLGFLSIELHWLGTLRGSVDEDRLRTVDGLLLEQRRILVHATGDLVDQWQGGELTDEEATRAIQSVLTRIIERIRQAAELWDPMRKA